MSTIPSDQWNDLYFLLSRIAKEILAKVSLHVSSGNYVSNYSSYPVSIGPSITRDWSTVSELSPYASLTSSERNYKFADYSSLLTIHDIDGKIRISELQGYQECVEFLISNIEIYSRLWYNEKTDYIELMICILLGKIINRYIVTTGKYDYDESVFKDVYTSITNTYLLDILEFNLCVPILFVKFDCDDIRINDNVSIVKMTNEFILSKHFIGNYDALFEKVVVDCATHMLVLKGYSYQNINGRSEENLSNAQVYPRDIIDSVFASIRVVTDSPTGYAQFIALPTNNWVASCCKGELIGLTGAKSKEYPSFFLDHFWLKPCVSISSDNCEKIASLASELISINQNAFKLACNRLNKSLLRQSDEDTILDAIIGLELLLSDNDKGELTYKISSRMATISTLHSECPYSPLVIQQSVSQIYRYRSDIVHSRKSRPATKSIQLSPEKMIDPVVLSIEFLKMAIKILVANPKYLDSKKIDELMMNLLTVAKTK